MLKNITDINKYKNRDKSQNYHEEYQYLNLLKDIINEGDVVNGRNGKTICGIGSALHFSLENGKIPILTTKKTAWKTCFKELLWFINGKMDNKILNEMNVHIWDGNSTPEFMEKCGLSHYRDGDLGSLYGHQWRFWNAPYEGCDADYTGKGIDQLENCINMLRDPEQRYSRRIIVSAWNPEQISGGVLPSCHNFFQFHVVDNKLSCTLYARSQDIGLGQPFNICSYACLTHIIANMVDLQPHEFILYAGNCHIYNDHIEALKQQIEREPYEFPTINILNKRENINDYVLEDLQIINYNFHPQIKMKMVA